MEKLQNNILSKRQSFRLSILENITLSMVLIPYITINISEKYHVIAFLFGIIFTVIYYLWIDAVRGYYNGDFLGRISGKNSILGKIVSGVYSFRYLLRGSLIILFFGQVAREFIISNYDLIWIIVPFFLTCIYGAVGGVERRGRIGEILFAWMIVPIILAAVLALKGINYYEIFNTEKYMRGFWGRDIFDVFSGAYFVLLIMSNSELMLVNKGIKNERKNNVIFHIIVWQIISVCFAYVCVVGVLGKGFVASKSIASLNVLEAAEFPGKIFKRLDYPIMAFWIIGVFVLASGYLFWAKKLAYNVAKNKYSFLVTVIFCVFFIYAWYSEKTSKVLSFYLFFIDFFIGVFIPMIYVLTDIGKEKKERKSGNKNILSYRAILATMVLFSASVFPLISVLFSNIGGSKSKSYQEKLDLVNVSNIITGEKKSSVENRDYCLQMEVQFSENKNVYSFSLVDVNNFQNENDGTGRLTSFEADSLLDALESYKKSNGREIDLGHLKQITLYDVAKEDERDGVKLKTGNNFNNVNTGEEYKKFIKETSLINQLPKSVEIIYQNGNNTDKNILRKLIKALYNGEGL